MELSPFLQAKKLALPASTVDFRDYAASYHLREHAHTKRRVTSFMFRGNIENIPQHGKRFGSFHSITSTLETEATIRPKLR